MSETLPDGKEMQSDMTQNCRYIILSILALMMTSIYSLISAQILTGKVVDENGHPLSYASVMLQSADSTYIIGTPAGEDGVFTIEYHPEAVEMVVSYITYRTCHFTLSGIESYDFGSIKMEPDAEMLARSVVTAVIPKTIIKDDAFVTQIENSVLAEAGSANDVLKKLPGVTSKDGALEVFGKGAPVIYVNGRMVRDNAELELLNSNEIKSVDVVQNPGARYDATVRAVIRIKTIRKQGEGFGFDLRSSWMQSENTDLVETANINYRYKGLDVFGTLNYTRSVYFQESDITQALHSANPLVLQQESYFSGREQDLTAVLGLNYQFNENHSIGVRYNPYLDLESYMHIDSKATAMIGDVLDDKTHTTSNGNSSVLPTHRMNLYYNGTVGRLNIDFNADMVDSRSSESTIYDEMSELQDNRVVTTLSEDRDRLYASKLVLTYPLFGGSLVAGTEYTYTSRRDDYINDEGFIPNSFTKIQEDNTNVFLEYSYPFRFGSLNAGVRYEHLAFNYFENDVLQQDQSRRFDNFYPNASFNAMFGKFMFQLSYAAKTMRPSYSQLSNAIMYIDRYSYTRGNPYLLPEIYHDMSFAAVWNFLQFSASYQIIQRAIMHLGDHQENNENGIALYYTNFERNIPTCHFMLSATPTISFWYPRVAIGIQKQWLSIDYLGEEKDLSKPVLFAVAGSSFKIPKGFMLDFDYSFTSKGNMRVYEIPAARHKFDIALRKSFLKDALSLELKGTDLFRTKSFTSIYRGPYMIVQSNLTDSRQVVLTLRYKFNSAKSKYKGTGAGEQQKNRF